MKRLQQRLVASLLCLLYCVAVQGYSSGAGSCHTANDGHGPPDSGSGAFFVQLVPSCPAPGSTVTYAHEFMTRSSHCVDALLRLTMAAWRRLQLQGAPFRGFMLKVTGPAGSYDGAGASFTGLGTHPTAQAKDCFGPAAATHRSPALKDRVDLQLQLPPNATELTITAIAVASRQSAAVGQWFKWTQALNVTSEPAGPCPAPPEPEPEPEPQPQPQPEQPDPLHNDPLGQPKSSSARQRRFRGGAGTLVVSGLLLLVGTTGAL